MTTDRQELKKKVREMQEKKRQRRVFDELIVCPDSLLVKLRDRLSGECNIEQAFLTEQFRMEKNK